MRMGNPWHGLPGPASCLSGMLSDTFAGFVEKVIRRRGVIGAVFGGYTDMADTVLRTESLSDDLGRLLCRELDLPPYNVSRTNVDCDWTPDLLGAVMESEHEFVRQFYS